MRNLLWVGLAVGAWACGGDEPAEESSSQAGTASGAMSGASGSSGAGKGGSAGRGGNAGAMSTSGSGNEAGNGEGASSGQSDAGSGGTSSGRGGSNGKGGTPGGAGEAGGAVGGAGNGGEEPECVTKADCTLPETQPADCAEADCVDGECKYSARDGDNDGFTAKQCLADDGSVEIAAGDDCDDGDDTVNPDGWDGPEGEGHEEGCNDGIDQDCSGTVDDDELSNSATCTCAPNAVEACGTLPNGVPIDFPLLDTGGLPVGECHFGTRQCQPDGSWGPCTGAQSPIDESCDGLNNDCDTQTDEDPTDPLHHYCDADADGHLQSTTFTVGCAPVGSCTGEWRSFEDGQPLPEFDDCDDEDPNRFPDKIETCDGVDNDCDGITDGISAPNDLKQKFYRDDDGDGYGRNAGAQTVCTQPSGPWILTGGDCSDDQDADDDAPQIHPGANELCNGKDDDCDANEDENPLTGAPSQPNTTFACQNGAWAITSCPAGTKSCDSSVANGCERDITTLTNCGDCNVACHLACGGSSCEEVVGLEGGEYYTCGTTTAGRGVCWGLNTSGQLGDTSTTERHKPVAVSGLTSVSAITAGTDHTCAIASPTSTLYCWGNDTNGQTGATGASGAANATPVTVAGIGATTMTGTTSVSAGTVHTCAVFGTGDVACWGEGQYGRVGDGNNGAHNVVAASRARRTTPMQNILNGVQVAVGDEHSCLLVQGGTVECWGRNEAGQLGDGTVAADAPRSVPVTGLSDVTAIAAGKWHTCAIATGGTVYCWGLNTSGQVGKATSTATYNTPQQVTGLSGVTALSAGQASTCALDGTQVKCWGSNDHGERGDAGAGGPTITTLSLTGVTRIGSGSFHACAVATGSVASCWGFNNFGQLGNNATSSANQPTPQTLAPL